MRLRALTGLRAGKVRKEFEELMKKIGEYKAILADRKLLLSVIKRRDYSDFLINTVTKEELALDLTYLIYPWRI